MNHETELNACENAVKIMLVEDQKADAILIKRALLKGGIVNPITVLRDGEEAMSYLKGEGGYADRDEHPLPDMILLDLKMPKMGGLDVLRELKQLDGLKRIPVVVLTSSALSSDVNAAYDLGANSYLVKPVKSEDFIKVARDIKCYWLLLNVSPQVEDK